MILVQPFDDNFCDNLLFLSSYWSETREREKGNERLKNKKMSMREKVV